ncbi:MAG TPA: hypothetical protein V6D12_09045 [Candidatus Obscuribacterales bacterium]
MTREKVLQVRLSEKEYQKLKAESERRGIPMAIILREPIRFLPDT